ncbi:MAG: DEAD/DEAH box helicase family protein [Candidatus Competibacteraceae bacterium]
MPKPNHRISEKTAETHIVESLSASPLYCQRPAAALDSVTLLNVDTTATFIQSTQPKEWAKLTKQFPGGEQEALAAHLTTLIQKRGTLEVLRNGVAFNGINLQLAYFRPAGGGNPEHQVRYESNRFAVLRQVHFSTKTPDQSVDLVICLNGLPIVSLELKNHFTGQNVQHAIAQYRRRDPKEPFWNRCLVHFAVDDDAVYMVTRLVGKDTVFLPFNRDTHNPVIYDRFTSSYLWDDFTDEDGEIQTGILRADSLLLLIQNYLHAERDEKTGKEKLIFPRFHQYAAVRKLLAHTRRHGSGHNYLIQHSAGSGKSNSIAWLAHQLANLCGADDQPIFDSIVVITDRRVLDKQLQGTIKQFEKIKGVVSKIDRNTRQLVKALERGDKIIITTLQKFGFIGELAKLSRRFAVIVDEAHSSQSGENVKDLKLVLTSEEQLRQALDKDEEEEIDPIEAELEKIQKARQRLPHLSFFAFTATPKYKTLELFGQSDPSIRQGFRPFHLYTMRQAIEEGFILDVLQNYTTYQTYFELIQNEQADGDRLVEELKARRLLLEYVDQHEFAIRRKAHIIVDHFTRKTAHKINGLAKAMLVTHSRAHAVLYKQTLDEVIREQNLSFGVLVAFTGTVTINEQKYTEQGMNPPGIGDIAEAFKQPEQRILVVANKFQTGFDQPLLHTLYVDKKLGGVAAVQTLSRINRTAPGKLDTLVLDFVNTQESIQASFQDYYQCTELEGATDPNKLYNLKYILEQMHIFTAEDVAEFVELFVVKKVTADKLQPFFQRLIETGYLPQSAENQDRFRKELARYVRQYNFISQIMTFVDAALEKFYLFAKLLLKQLPYQKQTLPLEVIAMIDMDKYRVQEEQNGSIVLAAEDGTLEPSPDDGHHGGQEPEMERIRVIVQKLNEDYGITFEEADRVINAIKQKLEADEGLRAAFKTSSIEFLRRQKLEDSINKAFLDNADEFLSFMAKTQTDSGFGKFFFSEMFKWYEKAVQQGDIG